MDKERLYWIDGVKGISAICVFMSHFVGGFIPEINYDYTIHLSNSLGGILQQSPLKIFINGHYMVALFCIISAYLMFIKASKQKLSIFDSTIIMVKRYFRLVLPIIPMAIIVYIFINMGLMRNIACASLTSSTWLASFYKEKIQIEQFIKILFSIPFKGDMIINATLWMISYIFWGTLIVLLISIVYNYNKLISYCVVLFLCFYFNSKSDLYLCSVLGTACAMFHKDIMCRVHDRVIKILGVLFTVLGLIGGGYSRGGGKYI